MRSTTIPMLAVELALMAAFAVVSSYTFVGALGEFGSDLDEALLRLTGTSWGLSVVIAVYLAVVGCLLLVCWPSGSSAPWAYSSRCPASLRTTGWTGFSSSGMALSSRLRRLLWQRCSFSLARWCCS